MSISYEEALETLQSMFGDRWTKEGLDTILRHHQGHMENTVDMILRHGDGSPEALLKQIEDGVDPRAQTAEADEALARQLSQQGRGGGGRPSAPSQQQSSSSTSNDRKKGRGTPTILPDDFLRIPNQPPSTHQMTDDEALARMLQDQMFSEEVSRNPDLAHLARGRPRTAGGVPARGGGGAAAAGRVPAGQPPDLDHVVKALGNLGNSAKRQFQNLATQFNAKVKAAQHNMQGGGGAAGAGGGGVATGGTHSEAHERRGLLDDGDDGEEVALEFASRKDL